MIGLGIIIINILLLLYILRFYFKYHKLSSTLLTIVLLSLIFKNSALFLEKYSSNIDVINAGIAIFILFSFSIIVATIQTGSLAVKYMYYPATRKTIWILSIVFVFLWFILNQYDFSFESRKINFFLNHIIEFTIVFIVLFIGLLAYKFKKQSLLLIASIGYFAILIILTMFGINSKENLAISQTFFVFFLVLNEKISIYRLFV